MGLLVVLLLFIFAASGFPAARRAADADARRLAASAFAHGQLDMLRGRDFAALITRQDNRPVAVPDPSGGGLLSLYWDVAVHPVHPHLKEVTVTARWLEGTHWRIVRAQTLVGRCGP